MYEPGEEGIEAIKKRIPEVSMQEQVLLVCTSPLNWEGDGLTDRAFSRSKLTSCDQSVGRLDLMSSDDASNFIVASLLQKDPARKLIGGLLASVEMIGAVGVDAAGDGNILRDLFVVKADPFKNELGVFEGHAVIGFSEVALKPRDNKKSFQTAAMNNLSLEFMKSAPAKPFNDIPWGRGI